MALDTSQLGKADIPKLRNIPVVTADGEEIGHVGDAYYDESSERLQCVGVAADAIGFSKRVIPVAGATIDDEGNLRLPYTRAQVEGAPDWADDDVESDEPRYDERWSEVSGYYGGTEADAALTRSDEDVRMGTREADTGSVRLRRWVETERVDPDEVPRHDEGRLVGEQTSTRDRVDVDEDLDRR